MDFGHSNGKIYQKLRSINWAYFHAIPSKFKFGLALPTWGDRRNYKARIENDKTEISPSLPCVWIYQVSCFHII